MDANSQIGFALNHIANFNSAMVQMNLQRFWAETLAQPRYADPKRLAHGFKVYSARRGRHHPGSPPHRYRDRERSSSSASRPASNATPSSC